uniref:Uncharacterized protein n=1 Tax=Mycena chlorophos TaxID=658473 RepID=A0ABQ0L3F0_MYCCL|nr:predicted protein [Mycena chlorophos]
MDLWMSLAENPDRLVQVMGIPLGESRRYRGGIRPGTVRPTTQRPSARRETKHEASHHVTAAAITASGLNFFRTVRSLSRTTTSVACQVHERRHCGLSTRDDRGTEGPLSDWDGDDWTCKRGSKTI